MSTTEQITSTAVPFDGKPPWDDGKWEGTAWMVTLSYDGRRFTVPFYQGIGIKGAPETKDVVECLLGDSCSADDATDEWDFFSALGFTPSREAKETYDACVKIAASMHELLGDDFDRFAYPDYEPAS